MARSDASYPSEKRVALKLLDKAIRVAGRRLQFASEKQRNEMLGYAASNMAEAYQIGAEEAQGEILRRLHEVRRLLDPGGSGPKGFLEKQREACEAYAERAAERRT
jgi:hypothetical protein